MNILTKLSSQLGDKTEVSNKAVAEMCVNDPSFIAQITAGFESKDRKLQSDCIEVFTMIAENHPQLIFPFAIKIIPLLARKKTKTRWEAVHTLAFIADKVPEIVFSVLPDLQELIEKDKSTIVRDYATDTIANYSNTSKEAAVKAFDILKIALKIWEDKHAKQVFKGFSNIIELIPFSKTEVENLVKPFIESKRNVVAKEAKRIIKKLNTF